MLGCGRCWRLRLWTVLFMLLLSCSCPPAPRGAPPPSFLGPSSPCVSPQPSLCLFACLQGGNDLCAGVFLYPFLKLPKLLDRVLFSPFLKTAEFGISGVFGSFCFFFLYPQLNSDPCGSEWSLTTFYGVFSPRRLASFVGGVSPSASWGPRSVAVPVRTITGELSPFRAPLMTFPEGPGLSA